MDVPTHIAEQIPILQSLHAQLALPDDALAKDMARIDEAVRTAIQSVVRSREDEVATWEAKINEEKRAIHSIARAVGDRGRSVLAEERRETMLNPSLPAQHERLMRQTEELEKVYKERHAKVEEMMATLSTLARLLGPPFDPPAPLKEIPDSMPVPARAAPRRSTMAPLLTAPTTNTNKRLSARNTTPETPPQSQTWMDVGEDVMASLEKAVSEALTERDNRLHNLETNFGHLVWFASELCLPPLPLGPLDEFPEHLLLPISMEETPGAFERYTQLLSTILAVNEPWDGEDDADAPDIQGMDGVEPEIGLLLWAEQLLHLWITEKDNRDSEIQELYEKIEPLWQRLEIPQEEIDLFVDNNQGSGESTIRAYEVELDRVLEIRKRSLSTFIDKVREEIAKLQDELLLSDNEKLEFGAFINDQYSEELLKEHEDESERLRAEINAKGSMLTKVKEWNKLRKEERELEISVQDPNRFKTMRGLEFLREEKKRKRVEKLKPKIEADLLASLPAWEEENGRPFTANGERVVASIEKAIADKKAAKGAKKQAKLGMGALPPSVKATPAQPARRVVSSTTRTTSNTTRKREAPTPCPLGGNGSMLKRSRIGQPSGMRSASSRPRLGGIPRAAATPTPASGGRAFGQPALGALANGSRPPPTATSATKPPDVFKSRPIIAVKSRKSFKPRSSLAAGLLRGVVEDVPVDEDLY